MIDANHLPFGQVFASFSYTHTAFASVVKLLNDGLIRPSQIATHRFPLERWEEGLDLLRKGGKLGEARGKILLKVGAIEEDDNKQQD